MNQRDSLEVRTIRLNTKVTGTLTTTTMTAANVGPNPARSTSSHIRSMPRRYCATYTSGNRAAVLIDFG